MWQAWCNLSSFRVSEGGADCVVQVKEGDAEFAHLSMIRQSVLKFQTV